MADRGGQPGNQNAVKNKPWTSAINRSLQQYAEGDVKAGQALRKIADRVVELALKGDKNAIDEIGNRLEGRPVQAFSGPEGEPLFGPLVNEAAGLRKKLRG